jgi:hypothetical protein
MSFTKLRVKIKELPVLLHEEIYSLRQAVDRTDLFEHGLDETDCMFWMVPDGKYVVEQGDDGCIRQVAVKDGKITWEEEQHAWSYEELEAAFYEQFPEEV